MIQDEFANWLLKKGLRGAAQGYPPAINRLSSHYYEQSGENIDIYAIRDFDRLKTIVDKYRQNGIYGEKGYEKHGLYRAAIAKYQNFFEEYLIKLPVPDPEPDTVGATIVAPSKDTEREVVEDPAPGEKARFILLRKVEYKNLNGKQQEIYNFHKLSGILADYGFSCIKLSDDWLGADFLACHIDSNDIIKIQLKSRLTIDKKYFGKKIFIAFPANSYWYLVEHDILVCRVREFTSWLDTKSWVDEGCYHSANPGAALLQSLSEQKLDSGMPAMPAYPPEQEKQRPPEELKRSKWRVFGKK